jgi:hypothetical protein
VTILASDDRHHNEKIKEIRNAHHRVVGQLAELVVHGSSPLCSKDRWLSESVDTYFNTTNMVGIHEDDCMLQSWTAEAVQTREFEDRYMR